MSAPQLYYGTPHSPFNHGHAGTWGYGQYPAIPYPRPLPPASVPDRVRETHAVRAEVGQTQATNQAAPTEVWPQKVYPNKQVSEGGASHMI